MRERIHQTMGVVLCFTVQVVSKLEDLLAREASPKGNDKSHAVQQNGKGVQGSIVGSHETTSAGCSCVIS